MRHTKPGLISADDLPGPAGARRFVGAEHGDAPVSLFLLDDPSGAGPRLHRHPYAELFIIHSGHARFEIDDAVIDATAGDILSAPAGSAHTFTSTGSTPLQMTAIHPAPRMDTEWLDAGPGHHSSAEGGVAAANRAAATRR